MSYERPAEPASRANSGGRTLFAIRGAWGRRYRSLVSFAKPMKAIPLVFVLASCLLSGCRSAQRGQAPDTTLAEWSGGGGCHVRGKFYSLNLTSERLRKTPAWDVARCDNPPVLPGKALALAGKELSRTFADAGRWTLRRVELEQSSQIPGVKDDLWNRWYYRVTFAPPENQRTEDMADGYEVCVLMDGAAVAPMQTAEPGSEPGAAPNATPPHR